MDYGIDMGKGREYLLQPEAIQEIRLMKFKAFAGKAADTPQGFFIGITQIIDHGYLMSRLKEFKTGVAADISGTAGNKDMHKFFPIF
jgi:hypothetical protein